MFLRYDLLTDRFDDSRHQLILTHDAFISESCGCQDTVESKCGFHGRSRAFVGMAARPSDGENGMM
jgi:hypothetical protein